MLKLVKYEFKKQAFSKYIIIALTGLLEIMFLIGLAMDREGVIGLSIGLLSMLAFGAVVYLAFESIDTFSKDLKQKSSYMLFLTPRTTYSIVGAKLITTAMQGILAAFIYFGVFVLNGTLALARYNQLGEIKNLLVTITKEFMQLDLNIHFFVAVVAVMLCSWLLTITIAFFSITLSTTFLANKKFKGIVSFIIFILINVAFSYITQKVNFEGTSLTEAVKVMWIGTIYSLAFIAVTYFGTAWMLDKKVSV